MANWHSDAGVAVGVVVGVAAALLIADLVSSGTAVNKPEDRPGTVSSHEVVEKERSGRTEVAQDAQAPAKPQQIAAGGASSSPDRASPQHEPSPARHVAVAELSSGTVLEGPQLRYLSEKWNPIHFKPAIDEATNDQCLACHAETVTHKVREASPAGLEASKVLAWYQTLDTYSGNQEAFHERHLTSPYASQLMNLKCNFCHQGNDPREESPGSSATTTTALGDFKLRKMVNPEKTCLMCHGKFPAASMGLEGSWAELREGFEDEETKNGCLTCHAEQFRTVRHQVNYLNPDAIETAAKQGSSDVCLGCHGGRAWYRTSYPYPRHAWPDMPEELPDWAKDRPTESEPQHRIKTE